MVSETASGDHGRTPSSRWIAADAPALRSEVAVSAVMFGVPCYGGALSTATLHGLLSTQRALLARRIRFECATTTNESLVTRARNSIVAHFLVSDCSHLFFIDADIGFGAEAVLRILAHDRPVIIESGVGFSCPLNSRRDASSLHSKTNGNSEIRKFVQP